MHLQHLSGEITKGKFPKGTFNPGRLVLLIPSLVSREVFEE